MPRAPAMFRFSGAPDRSLLDADDWRRDSGNAIGVLVDGAVSISA